jgi:hypothetical protein
MNLTPSSLSPNEPGTLVWVGPKTHPEFKDAFQFCLANSAQLALRNHLQELAVRPAGFVKRIVIARADRRPMPACLLSQIVPSYRNAEILALNSSLCDGEFRTGEPWELISNLRFSRWQEKLPDWLAPCGYRKAPSRVHQSLLLLSDRYETAEPYLNYAAALGRTVFWKRAFNALSIRNVDHVVWDDSVAPAAETSVWRNRIAYTPSSAVCHSWLVTQGHACEIQAALAGGVSKVYTKPTTMNALFAN